MPFKPSQLQWFHATRLLGALCVLYGLFIDHSPDRATIIITGAGMLGLEKVARSEPGKDK